MNGIRGFNVNDIIVASQGEGRSVFNTVFANIGKDFNISKTQFMVFRYLAICTDNDKAIKAVLDGKNT